jgi:hypothetical protein
MAAAETAPDRAKKAAAAETKEVENCILKCFWEALKAGFIGFLQGDWKEKEKRKKIVVKEKLCCLLWMSVVDEERMFGRRWGGIFILEDGYWVRDTNDDF